MANLEPFFAMILYKIIFKSIIRDLPKSLSKLIKEATRLMKSIVYTIIYYLFYLFMSKCYISSLEDKCLNIKLDAKIIIKYGSYIVVN